MLPFYGHNPPQSRELYPNGLGIHLEFTGKPAGIERQGQGPSRKKANVEQQQSLPDLNPTHPDLMASSQFRF
jgi:hypothetical protein